jgi:hypothetical protein
MGLANQEIYQYEVDGSTETYDPSMPTTNVCPYLPGQTLNTLEVPIEQTSRLTSASMTSLHDADFKTMNPRDKFMTPRPAPPVPESFAPRAGTSPSFHLNRKRSARSLSPSPSWTGTARRFFGLKLSSRGSDSGRGLESSDSDDGRSTANGRFDGARSTTPSDSGLRDLSPESLRRFLLDDTPTEPPVSEHGPKIYIPEDIVEENEDDDNFATSAISESIPFTTLSPPPFQRSFSSPSVAGLKNESTLTIVPQGYQQEEDAKTPSDDSVVPSTKSAFKLDIPQLQFSLSDASSSMTSPTSLRSAVSHDNSNYSFFDESNDDDDDFMSAYEDDCSTSQQSERSHHIKTNTNQPFTGYSLPQPKVDNQKHLATVRDTHVLGSPALLARSENGMPLGNATLLSVPGIDTGIDDLMNEISWMADVIQPKDI